MYDYDVNSQRPSSRGSKHSVESHASTYSSGYNHYHQNNQQHAQYGSGLDDDDDDDMW